MVLGVVTILSRYECVRAEKKFLLQCWAGRAFGKFSEARASRRAGVSRPPPEIEIVEGPAELLLAIKEQQVVPRRFDCATKVPGGKLMLTAKGSVTERTEVNLIYRLKYRTKDGDRQTSGIYIVTLFP